MTVSKGQFPDMPVWFDQAISNRIGDVCDLCDDHTREHYKEFMVKLSLVAPAGSPLYLELENLFILQMRQVVERAYPFGLHDGVSLAIRLAR